MKTNVAQMFPRRWVTPKKDLTFVVNGQPTPVTRKGRETVRAMTERAMKQTANDRYGPLDRWEARDTLGRLLPFDEPLPKMHWDCSGTVYVNLRPGVYA